MTHASHAPRLAHIGVAVESIEAAAKFYRDILGVDVQPLTPADGATIAAVTLGDIDIELLEPASPDSPIARFLAKRGPGIHHLCLRVPNLDAALDEARRRGYRLVDDTPRIGAHGQRIAFLHPKSTAGTLIELTE